MGLCKYHKFKNFSKDLIMRRAFTLIELMITILITTIFLNFVFKFYNNILVELRYLEAQDSLAYNAFRASQIIKNGVYQNNHIGGVVTLDSLVDSKTFLTNDGNTTSINTTNQKLVMSNAIPSEYRLNSIDIDNFSLRNITGDLYLYEFNATKYSQTNFSELKQANYKLYQTLVYAK